ncbi:MAG: hypothetical protein RBU37_27015, partial [Myxococcota bacterium]|nr:hypothetical protein [Myxococcota bacterium]
PLTKGPTQLLASSLVPLLLSTWSCMLAAYLALGPAQGQQSPAACLVSPGNSPATHENQQLDQDRPLSENPELDLQWALLLAIATVLLGTWAAITLSSRLPLGALATLMAPYLLLWLAWERARLRAQHGNHRQLVALFLAAWAFLAFSGRLGDGPVLLSQLEGETALHQRMHP